MSSYSKVHLHVVFATRQRVACLDKQWRAELWAYMAGTINALDGHARIVGGWKDHVHILADISTTQTIAALVRETKKASTAWVRQHDRLGQFQWQDGYAVFSVGWRELDRVSDYIANQEEHHRTRTFLEELTAFLDEASITYDPKYLP